MKCGSPTRLSHFSHTLSHYDFSVFLKCPSNFPIMVFVFLNTCGFVEFSTWRALYWCHNSARWFSCLPAAWPLPFTAIGCCCFVWLLFLNAFSYQSLPLALHALSSSQRFCAAVSLSKCALPTFGLGWLRLALLNIVGGSKRKKENPAIFWPNSCISYVLTCILFLSPLPTFFFLCFFFFFLLLSHAASNPSFSFSSPFLTPLWLVGPFSPAILSPRPPPIHALCLNQNKCSSSDRLAPINCLDPCSMTTSPFYGKPPSVMDDLFISALPRLFSLPVLRCLLFSPSKDGYAPKSVYPLRYVIVSNLPLFVYLLLISFQLFFLFHLSF